MYVIFEMLLFFFIYIISTFLTVLSFAFGRDLYNALSFKREIPPLRIVV